MLTNYSHLFIIIIISTNFLPFSLQFLPFCYTFSHLDCELQKMKRFASILCTVQWCSSSAPSLSTVVLIATMVEIQGKNHNWQIFLADVFTIILYIPTTRREVLKKQLKNEAVPYLFYRIIPVKIFKALAMEQPELLEHILEQHRTWTRERVTWSIGKMMPQPKL